MKLRTPVVRAGLSGLAAVLLALVLLFVFQQVVQAGVSQGAARRMATAQLHEATWRCNALRGRQARQDCLDLIPRLPDDKRAARLEVITVAPSE